MTPLRAEPGIRCDGDPTALRRWKLFSVFRPVEVVGLELGVVTGGGARPGRSLYLWAVFRRIADDVTLVPKHCHEAGARPRLTYRLMLRVQLLT